MIRLHASSCRLAVLLLVWVASPLALVGGELLDLTLNLLPPSISQNRVSITIDVQNLGSKTDSTDATGTLPVQMDLTYDSVTHAASAQSLRFIEQNPGSIAFSGMSFEWKIVFATVLQITSSNIKATGKSPSGLRPVTEGGAFPTSDHRVVLNNGTFTTSGLVTTNINFTAEPLETTTLSTGYLTVSTPVFNGDQATYTVELTLPLIFSETVTTDPSVMVQGNGIIRAARSFTRTVDDGDGMPTDWEQLYNLNPLVNDGGMDDDGDQLTNYEEYVADTDPRDPGSCLTCGLTMVSPTRARVTFPASPRRVYRLEGVAWLRPGPWDEIDALIPGQDDTITVDFTPDPSLRYFRVVTHLP